MATLTALILSCLLSTGYGIECHHCKGVTDPQYCIEMVVCGQNEECFSDLVIGDFENVFYNSGCRNKNICKLIVDNRLRRNQLAACEECCGTDGCNMGLCKHAGNATTSECYNCDNVDDPTNCHDKITCAKDEMCITETYVDENFKEKYKMGCEQKKRCDILKHMGRREVTTCIECCSTSGCNRHLC